MTVAVTNDAIVTFSPSGGDWTSGAPTYYVGLWVRVGSTDHYLAATGAMTGVTESVEDGDTIRFSAGQITHNFSGRTGHDFGDDGFAALINNTSASFRYSLHDDDPVTTGANELTSGGAPGYARQAAAVTAA